MLQLLWRRGGLDSEGTAYLFSQAEVNRLVGLTRRVPIPRRFRTSIEGWNNIFSAAILKT